MGAFSHTSQHGNRYIMVAVHLNANYIFAEPMKNRTEEEMIRVYQKILNRMKAAGLGLRKQVLDCWGLYSYGRYEVQTIS